MKTMHMIGNAHIDPVWLWQWREGFHEVKATFRSALDRMNETPDFVFTCACACYYQWVEENDPEMFEEIRARVKEGRWAVVGGMWIQPDMNAPSGESIARQLLYSQRYFKERFGFAVNTGYNVDSFGHNAMMPQLFKKAGIENYIWMRPGIHENPDIPEGPMTWEAPDGSRVQAYRIYGEYTTSRNVPEKIDRLFAFSEKIGRPVLCFYGVGNHGGGPTIQNLKEINAYRTENEKGGEVIYSSPIRYFDELKKSGAELPVWKNELQHHASGCYSTHSLSKHKHREAENAMLRMEKFCTLSGKLTGHKPKSAFVQQGWNNLMFNEFHDLMGGCSLPEAMDQCVIQLDETLSIADREENAALQKISWKIDTSKGNPVIRSKEDDWKLWGINGQGTPLVVFNPHPFDAEGSVVIRRPIRAIRDDSGNPVPAQIIRATRTNGEDRWDGVFRAQVPAMGYRLYWLFKEEVEEFTSPLTASEKHIENDFIRAEFDPLTGALTHLIDKKTGRDALTAPARPKLMDIEHVDTWAHMVFKFDRPAGTFSDAQVTVQECGPVRAVVRVITRFGLSTLEQKYILYANADQLEVEAKLDMHEKHRMLKLCFPTNGKIDVAEIPYGAIKRTANGDEEHCQRWVSIHGNEDGLAMLNDGKYSYSAIDGELRMTIANTSILADHYGQAQRDDTCQFMDMGVQKFRYALVPYSGCWRKQKLNRRAALLNQGMPAIEETYHVGPLGSEYSAISLGSETIDLGAMKRAENGEGYVLRFAECAGKAQEVEMNFRLANRSMNLSFTPWEIKTVLVPDNADAPVREIPITEIEE